jgi:hypothetical protein
MPQHCPSAEGKQLAGYAPRHPGEVFTEPATPGGWLGVGDGAPAYQARRGKAAGMAAAALARGPGRRWARAPWRVISPVNKPPRTVAHETTPANSRSPDCGEVHERVARRFTALTKASPAPTQCYIRLG